ncbi:olfactory receptor-like protein COR8 [Latimeria chalumnae]|uniref:olfactory receptor-like protein COR8 n=1 Tax=Latimeria chalumnae TaxID=7897 RepID=UPI00313D153E
MEVLNTSTPDFEFYLIAAVIKIANAESQRKAFSTCISHLFLVLMFYIPLLNDTVTPIIEPLITDLVT